jgi:ribosomal protein S18 acetylase RimI-like enzyme
MIGYISDRIKANGGKALQLNVNRNNKAIDFYKKHGFEIIREEDNDIGEGFFMNDFVMEKKI